MNLTIYTRGDNIVKKYFLLNKTVFILCDRLNIKLLIIW